MTKFDRSKFKPSPILPMLLDFHKHTVESEIDSIKEYIIDNRDSIKIKQTEFNGMIDEQAKKHPNDVQELHEFYEEQYYRYNDFYPTFFNNSNLLSLYSFFEFNLKHLCITLQRQKQFKIKIDDLNGQNYIEKSRKYLQLVVGINENSLNENWEQIKTYQSIRNCIVHNNSNIIKDRSKKINKQQLYHTINGNENLKLDEERGTFIITNDKFILDFCDVVKNYLLTIIIELQR